MIMKQHILTALSEELDRWEGLLAGLSEQQLTASLQPSAWSIKDVIAHLMAWQQYSIARLEAAMLDRETEFPKWLAELPPDSEDNADQTNVWIYETYREQFWSTVHQNWKEGFLRFLELGEALSEEDLLEKEYPWFKGYALYVILVSTYGHHHIEHYEPLRAWLREHGGKEKR